MNWIKDKTGRFPERPYYTVEELDRDCEEFTHQIMRERHNGKLVFPIPTDDLTVMIERAGADLDLYADLSGEGTNVEGVTEFFPGRKPRVKVSHLLTDNPSMENRFRTTLTHECGHVRFHRFLCEMKGASRSLFPESNPEKQVCRRELIVSENFYDWMEWQAGYCCGAMLMPFSNVRDTMRAFMLCQGTGPFPLAAGSSEGQDLVARICSEYGVSNQAARIRLVRAGGLVAGAGPVPALWG